MFIIVNTLKNGLDRPKFLANQELIFDYKPTAGVLTILFKSIVNTYTHKKVMAILLSISAVKGMRLYFHQYLQHCFPHRNINTILCNVNFSPVIELSQS